jgi:hypothetical protein
MEPALPDEPGIPPAPPGVCELVPAAALPGAVGLDPASDPQPAERIAKAPSIEAETSLMTLLGVQRPLDPRVGRQ